MPLKTSEDKNKSAKMHFICKTESQSNGQTKYSKSGYMN